jgi:hypothetical protein
MKKVGVVLSWVFLAGCLHRQEPVMVKISLTNDNHSLKISGLDRAIIADIGRDSSLEAWESLLPVYKMPGDTEMKDFQPVQPGHYRVDDSLVIFTPDTVFEKGQSYFLRYYHHEGTTAWDYIRDNKRPGSSTYNDLIFGH